jgi:cardiolipin synthase
LSGWIEYLSWGAPAPWALGVAAAALGGSLWASIHVVLYKRDERAAVGWIGLIWLAPVVGALLYLTMGINRIQRRAFKLRGPRPPVALGPGTMSEVPALQGIRASTDRFSRFPLVAGNRIQPLRDGDETYPAMWADIDRAQGSIELCTYIFDRDPAGLAFVERLAAARARGVDVRVLADDAGLRYSRPTVLAHLRRRDVKVRRFLPAGLRWFPYVNLRTHRKILVVDGSIGYTGGLNIRVGHQLQAGPRHPVQDLHFRLEGPIVAQLSQIFLEDWTFAGGDALALSAPSPPAGDAMARTISDGPDEDMDQLRRTYLAGLACAERSVRILTPYFLPDQSLRSGLITAASRGVEVDVVLPARSNLPFVQWAMWGQLLTVAEGCRVWLTPPPFDHSKLMLVDDQWVLMGSGNWDPRSYRLNFELNVEIYDAQLGREMAALVQEKVRGAERLTAADVLHRPWPLKFRDGVARLFAPIL